MGATRIGVGTAQESKPSFLLAYGRLGDGRSRLPHWPDAVAPGRRRRRRRRRRGRWGGRRLPLLWLSAPLLYLPGVPWLGQCIYLWVARNRFNLVPCRDGVCDIQKKG